MRVKVKLWWLLAAIAAVLITFANEFVVPSRVFADTDEQVTDDRDCDHNPAHCPDLAVSFQSVPDPLPLNIAQTVNVTVTNLASQRTARIPKGTVVLALTLSLPLTYDAFSAPPDFACTPAGVPVTTIQCRATRRTSLPSGQNLTFALTFTNASPTSALSLTAVVDPAQAIRDANRVNNTATAVTTIGGLVHIQEAGILLACDRGLDGPSGTRIACEGFLQAPPAAGGQWIVPKGASLGFLSPEGLQVNTLVASQGFTCPAPGGGFLCSASAPIALSPNQVLQVFSVGATLVGTPPVPPFNLRRVDVSLCEIGIPWLPNPNCIGIGGSVDG